MQLIPLALCLIAGSVQTISLSSSVISLYNTALDGKGGDTIVDISGGITQNQYYMKIAYLILGCIGLIFGAIILSIPDQFYDVSNKVTVSIITLIWLLVTFITCYTTNNEFTNLITFQNNVNKLTSSYKDTNGNILSISNNQLGFNISYIITFVLTIIAIIYIIM